MKNKYQISLIIVCITLSLFCIIPQTSADPTVMISNYSLSPEVFMPGDTGILTLTIKNTESTNTVQQTSTSGSSTSVETDTVAVTIENVWIGSDGDGTNNVKAFTNYEDVGDLSPGTTITVDFKMIAETHISEGFYFPTANVDVENYEDVQFPIKVKVSNATVDLLITDVPSKISMSGATSITITAVNSRDNDVEGVTIVPQAVEGIEFTPNSVYIGELESDSSSDATFSIKPSDTGEKTITFNLEFKNGDNVHNETLPLPIEIVNTLDVGSIFTNIPRSIEKGGSSRITLEVYNAKTETITGVIVTPISNSTVLPSQYFIGSMEADDVFSASFDIYTDDLEIGSHSVDFEVSFKQGNEYYKIPSVQTSFSVVNGQGLNYQGSGSTTEDMQMNPFGGILGICVPIIIIIVALVLIVILLKWNKRRNTE